MRNSLLGLAILLLLAFLTTSSKNLSEKETKNVKDSVKVTYDGNINIHFKTKILASYSIEKSLDLLHFDSPKVMVDI